MNRKQLLQEISARLDTLRKHLNLSREEMASHCGLTISGYAKNERGNTFLGFDTLARLGKTFDISLDWLILDKGPIYYRLKEGEAKPAEPDEAKPAVEGETLETVNTLPQAFSPGRGGVQFPAGLEGVGFDVEQMLERMALDPQFRYEVLASFHKYLKDHPTP